jgi:hypothetical protein
VSGGLVTHLRGAEHDVVYVAEMAPGIEDAGILARAHDEARLLLTEDKDFGELVFRWKSSIPGLVLLRIDSERHLLKWQRLDAAIGHFGATLFGHYTVIEAGRFRSRRLPVPTS